ncbi:hypothetical protein CHLRE_04g217240v5 [Chlamydomonas reinhardtii]|uniref:Uncharacterized protein n=1 Tax=Chlamydomonas reinhardtii TaxID=3055 RepID=A0A2K3DTC9_CHLRE|nr:uncharacterized protein CHLRE_04g217240v5 [Chlamydomonas reinhardtii]PNW83784.1 hypothetical protein CHLRE_04g217240v5 [Chlamydomonas reinhardtii]
MRRHKYSEQLFNLARILPEAAAGGGALLLQPVRTFFATGPSTSANAPSSSVPSSSSQLCSAQNARRSYEQQAGQQ